MIQRFIRLGRRRAVTLSLLSLACGLVLLGMRAIRSRAALGSGVERLAWLAGCWQAQSPGRLVEEHWLEPRGSSMIGVGRTVRADTLLEYELLIIREEAGGEMTYEAHPSGQPTATFTARTFTDSSIVFENSAHDFPQRVGYQRRGADSLVAWIEGKRNGKTRKVEFPYARVHCP
jgi:hypothetical protein